MGEIISAPLLSTLSIVFTSKVYDTHLFVFIKEIIRSIAGLNKFLHSLTYLLEWCEFEKVRKCHETTYSVFDVDLFGNLALFRRHNNAIENRNALYVVLRSPKTTCL